MLADTALHPAGSSVAMSARHSLTAAAHRERETTER